MSLSELDDPAWTPSGPTFAGMAIKRLAEDVALRHGAPLWILTPGGRGAPDSLRIRGDFAFRLADEMGLTGDEMGAALGLCPETVRCILIDRSRAAGVVSPSSRLHVDDDGRPWPELAAAFAAPQGRRVRAIVSAVAARQMISVSAVLGLTRQRRVTLVRQMAIYWILRETRLSLSQIGRGLNRHHTTILSSGRAHAERYGLPPARPHGGFQ